MERCPIGTNRCHSTQTCLSRVEKNSANSTRCKKGFRKCVDRKCYNNQFTRRQKVVRALHKMRDVVNDPQKLSKFLKNVCNDAGSCLTFGRYVGSTKKLLDNFTNFDYAVNPLQRLGKPSGNGFVYEVSYKRYSFTGQAVLKFSKVSNDVPDNLFYEYLVGYYFINKCSMRFPCFLETYGLYNVDNKTHKYMETNQTGIVKIAKIKSKLKLLSNDTDAQRDNNLQLSCQNPSNICLLIQHLRVKGSLGDYFKRLSSNSFFFNYILPQLLFQVYAPLTRLINSFTHYDLHTDNVLIYDLGNTNYIQMNYIYQGNDTISFKPLKISNRPS
jgi:hypothetical protein